MSNTTLLNDSALDTKRFGVKVVRGRVLPGTSSDDVFKEVMETDATVIILRTDAGDSDTIVRLQRSGWPAIHADTLVHYGADLTLRGKHGLPDGVRLANFSDRDAVHEIAEHGFAGYRSHYAANPFLPRDQILAGYIEWAKSRLEEETPNGRTWIVSHDNLVAGFATCDLSADAEKVEIVLNATHPKFARRGLYGRLLSGILDHYAHQSFRRIGISTQLWNYTVQRQWVRAGLSMEKAYDTYHFDRRLRTHGPLL